MVDEETNVILTRAQDLKAIALEYTIEVVQQNHQCNDFCELLELTIIYLGGVPPSRHSYHETLGHLLDPLDGQSLYGLKVFSFYS